METGAPEGSPERSPKGSVETDLELVSRIGNGDPDAWAEFVERFTGWVLYRATKWCMGTCPHSASGIECGLLAVSRKMRGVGARPRTEECDDGMDIYVWIIEQLKKKAAKYKAKNGSRLSTYIFTVLNSKELYVDWLRWKYGRVF